MAADPAAYVLGETLSLDLETGEVTRGPLPPPDPTAPKMTVTKVDRERGEITVGAWPRVWKTRDELLADYPSRKNPALISSRRRVRR